MQGVYRMKEYEFWRSSTKIEKARNTCSREEVFNFENSIFFLSLLKALILKFVISSYSLIFPKHFSLLQVFQAPESIFWIILTPNRKYVPVRGGLDQKFQNFWHHRVKKSKFMFLTQFHQKKLRGSSTRREVGLDYEF